MSNLEKLWKVYTSLIWTGYQGLGLDAHEEERQLLAEMICELCNYPKGEFDELINDLITSPCQKAFYNPDCREGFREQVSIMEKNFPRIYTIISKEV